MKLSRLISPDIFGKSYLLACGAIMAFFASYHLLDPILPVYLKAHAHPAQQIGAFMAGFMGISLIARPLSGKWADEYEKKKLLLIAILIFSVAPVLYQLADQSFYLLMATRIIHGASYALFYTTLGSYIVNIIPADKKAEGISYYSNAMKIPMAFIPGLAFFLMSQRLEYLSFSIAALLGLLALLMVWQLPPMKTIAPQATGGKLFNVKALYPGLIMMTTTTAFGALIPFAGLIGQEKGVSIQMVGWFYTAYAVFLIFSRALTGRLSDVYGRNVVLVPGLILVPITLSLIAFVHGAETFILAGGLYGLAAGTVQPSLLALAVDKTEAHERGSATATFTMFNDIGIAVGSYILGALGTASGYLHAFNWIIASSALGCLVFMVVLVYRLTQKNKALTLEAAPNG